MGDGLKNRLQAANCGEVLFDAFSRGRYATDASSYQIMPLGVVVPSTIAQAEAAIGVAREEGVSILPRGGGTSQCGQTVNDALVLDCSKALNKVVALDVTARTCRVEPGIVLDDLNRKLKPHGLWFPVDVSTASRATIGGMAGNNSCGGRSLRYGTMRDNVIAMDAVLADGTPAHFGTQQADLGDMAAHDPRRPLFSDLLAIGAREAKEVEARYPAVQRRVGGYNLDALVAKGSQSDGRVNMAHLLVGSEGTLAFTTAVELKLWPLIGRKALGVCHFGSFYEAMDAAQHLVALKPIAVELVDATMLSLAGAIAMFRPTLERFVKGEPAALLLVEFAEDDAENTRRLRRLHDVMGSLGFGWDKDRRKWGGVVDVLEPGLQAAITDLRTSGLNIMMSMKDARKPVSFVEDCAVPLPHLAAYTERLTSVFEKHGTTGTWYAHASEGCLHVRPVLNLKLEKDVKAMRAIAEEAFALVREYKGSHSGEHGDGIVRSEFHEPMFGAQLVRGFEEVKDRFDPTGLLNPGKIVRAPRFDDRTLLRFNADYAIVPMTPVLDWSAYPGPAGGFSGAVEMCNNNGACRKLAGGSMCPSYRVTRNEKDVTRGRANVLRLALSKQLGPDALTSDSMADAMRLCVSCKACKLECPTGVDMARMKIEVLAARVAKNGLSLRDRLVGYLPRYAPWAAKVPSLLNLRNRIPVLAWLVERVAGFSARRSLPVWRRDRFDPAETVVGPEGGREVVLFADTFNRAFERENLDAALQVLVAGGYRVHLPKPADGSSRPLCCGRTFLSVGLVEEAKREIGRSLETLLPYVAKGMPVIGLEPSCLLSFRDEALALLPGDVATQVAGSALLFEEFLAQETDAGRLVLALKPIGATAVLHGHCHQKSFRALAPVEKILRLIPGLKTETIESSCCGMAGAFGYQAETIDTSLAMAELSLLPAVRAAPDALVIADGTSCRHQIHDGTQRQALHVARVLAASLEGDKAGGGRPQPGLTSLPMPAVLPPSF
ncbi:FAD-binding and (Fe-S)-binding domain-containing protein [Beijerinckia sp. L45]|uniref:FAD-binding and (Fe-S)-binding domain-containing protein n=1 Tax=Beijerinckia sp. L45 TaxID=1641855 RepID=UPI00131ACEC5|nr:FAD-binding and (Fe-S)-binding domain-containing protein [Beijerinckia sp. L45]